MAEPNPVLVQQQTSSLAEQTRGNFVLKQQVSHCPLNATRCSALVTHSCRLNAGTTWGGAAGLALNIPLPEQPR